MTNTELKNKIFSETAMAEKLADTFDTETYAIEANTLINLIIKLGLMNEYEAKKAVA